MSYLALAKKIESRMNNALINECLAETTEIRFGLLKEALITLNKSYQSLPPSNGSVVLWIARNCSDLIFKISELDVQIDQACLNKTIPLDTYRDLLNQWIETYCEGFIRFNESRRK